MVVEAHADVLNEACDAAVDNVDKGAVEVNGVAEFWSGVMPAGLQDAPAGDLLAVVDFAQPAFGDAGAGALDDGVARAASLPLDTVGVDDGDIGFVRVLDRADPRVVRWRDDDVGTAGTRIVVNTTTVSVGVNFSVTEWLFSVVEQGAP